MRAMTINSFGGPDVFQLSEVPMPTLLPGHVLIKVAASSINPLECKIRSGTVALSPAFPAILNGDVAGTITATAKDVTQFNVGDDVFGCIGGVIGMPGVLAEYALADARLLARKPQSLTLSQTAALPIVALTAWDALFHKLHISAGKSILIHGGVGGVGHIAVQLAKQQQCKVITTVGSESDLPLARQLGATEVVNFREETVTDYVKRLSNNRGFDYVFDTVGGDNLINSLQAVAINGGIATTNARTTLDLSGLHAKAVSLHGVFTVLPLLHAELRAPINTQLTQIAALIDAGHLTIITDSQLFKFSEIADAHRYVEARRAHGKVVLINDLMK